MAEKIKAVINGPYFFPVLILYYGVFHFLFGEKIPASEGLGFDGIAYASAVKEFLHSPFVDSKFVMRMLPAAVVRTIFLVFHFEMTVPNIIKMFQLMNLILMVLSCVYFKKILVLVNIESRKQFLAHILLFLNFFYLKFIHYYPIITDTAAFFESILLLYFFLKKKQMAVLLTALAGAFTWPIVFYQGLLLFAFPYHKYSFESVSKKNRFCLSLLSVLYFFALVYYFVLYLHLDTAVSGTEKIDTSLLVISIPAVLLAYYFLPFFFHNKILWAKNNLVSHVLTWRLLVAAILLFTVHTSANLLVSNNSVTQVQTQNFFQLVLHFISTEPVYGVAKPFLYLVAGTSYFGVLFLLLLLFWKQFSYSISKFGLGLVLAFAGNLLLEIVTAETRGITNLFPWMVVFFVLAVNKKQFSNIFYILAGILNLVSSKFYLPLNSVSAAGVIDEMPGKYYWINFGPWINWDAYAIQSSLAVLFLVLLFFSLFALKFKDNRLFVSIRTKATL